MTSSALAYLCYAVSKGYVDYTKEICDVLSHLEAAKKCREACPYGYDIPGYVSEFIEENRDKLET